MIVLVRWKLHNDDMFFNIRAFIVLSMAVSSVVDCGSLIFSKVG
jgi:hypothetical protein